MGWWTAGQNQRVVDQLREQSQFLAEVNYAAQFERVSEHFAHGDFMTHRAGLYALVPRGDEPDLRGFEARHLSRRTAARPMVSLDYPPGGTRTGRSFGMRPDRHEFAIATLGSVRFHAFDTLATSCAPIATRTDRNVRAIEYSRDGRHLILGNDHRALRVYERRGESWQLITERKLSGPIASVATIGGNDASGPSDEQVAVYTEDGKLQVLLLSDLSVVRVLESTYRGILSIRSAADVFLVGNISTGEVERRGPGHGTRSEMPFTRSSELHMLAISSSGEVAGVAPYGVQPQVVRLSEGRPVTLSGAEAVAHDLALSADGRRVALSGHDGWITVHDTQNGALLHAFHAAPRVSPEGDPRGVETFLVGFSASSDQLVTASRGDGKLRLWDLRFVDSASSYPVHPSTIWCLAYDSGASELVTCSDELAISRVEETDHGLRLGPAVGVSIAGLERPDECSLDSSGRQAVVGMGDRRVLLLEIPTADRDERGSAEATATLAASIDASLGPFDTALHVGAFSRGGSRIALVFVGGKIRFLERRGSGGRASTTRWHETAAIDHEDERLKHAAFSADGNLLAVASNASRGAWVYRFPSGELVGHLRCLGEVRSLVFSHAGTRLIIGGSGGMVDVFDLPSTRSVIEFRARGGEVHSLALSADDRRLAVGGGQGTVEIWMLFDSTDGRSRSAPLPLATLRDHPGPVEALRFSRDGRCLFAGGGATDGSGLVTAWHAPPIDPPLPAP